MEFTFKFSNLLELIKCFDTEEKCVSYFEQMRWNGKRVCPHCGCDRTYNLNDGRYKCGNKDCYKKFTVKVGTMFDSSTIPLLKWFMAIYVVTSHKKGISSCQLGKDIGVTQKTAWFMLQRIRNTFYGEPEAKLSGTVEVDETYIGGVQKGKRGRGAKDKTPVIGLIERSGEVRAEPIEDVTAKTLHSIIEKNVEPESQVMTDSFRSYNNLSPTFSHCVINHSEGKFVVGSVHTNTIEGFWSLMKRGIIGIYHKVSKKHLGKYCDEFSFRYNSRKMKEAERFNLTLRKKGQRLRYRVLIASPDGKVKAN